MVSERALLVGLGNPGPKYADNRHNIGFMAVDAIARRFGFGAFRTRFHGEIAGGEFASCPVLALKPMTYMNDAGRSVAETIRFYKFPLSRVFVFHDELDLPAAKVRVKRGGGAAGHNGLRSIDARLGPDYWRVRLGIGHPGDKRRVLGHVLDDFDAADRQWLDPLLNAVAEHTPLLVSGDPAVFASKLALALNPPRPKPTTPSRRPPPQREGNGTASCPDGRGTSRSDDDLGGRSSADSDEAES